MQWWWGNFWELPPPCIIFLTKSREHSLSLSEHSPLFPGPVDNSFQAAPLPVSSRWQEIPRQVSGNRGCADNAHKSCVFIWCFGVLRTVLLKSILKGKNNLWVNDGINLKYSLSQQTQGNVKANKKLFPSKLFNENIIMAATSSRQLWQKRGNQ